MINTQLLIGYREIYGENQFELSELVSQLPIKKVGQIISRINLEIQMGPGNAEQMKYLAYFYSHWSSTDKSRFIQKAIGRKTDYVSPENIHYFSRHSLLYLFFKILKYSQNRSVSIERDLTYKDRDSLFKAILLVNDEVNDRSFSGETDFSQYEEFRKFMWRTSNLQNQFDSSDPIIKIIKAKCLFDLLQNDDLYSLEIKRYLNQNEAENTWTLLLRDRLQPFINSSKILEQPGEITPTLQINSPQRKFIKSLIINELDLSQKNFTLRIYKEKPLLKINDDQCVVLDWGIYNEQLFEAIIFDFYNSTRISEIGGFKNFLHYKNRLIDKLFYEEYLLNRIVEILFPRKHQIKLSEDDLRKRSKVLTPDYYVRDGKDVYIIEFKNSYYPSSIDRESDYNKIKNSIDKKYNTSNAGVGQQVKRIKYLATQRFEDVEDKRYPRNRNLNIFPIIIFSDVNYDIPGVGRYLNDCFQNQIDENISSVFKNIMPLVFVHIDYFFEYIDLFLKNPSVFKDHLVRFKTYQISQEKNLSNTRNKFKINQELDIPFTYRIRRLYNYKKNSKEFLKAAFDAFDLLQNT